MSELSPKLSRRVARLRKAVEARAVAALAFPYVLTCKADDAAMNRSATNSGRRGFTFIPSRAQSRNRSSRVLHAQRETSLAL